MPASSIVYPHFHAILLCDDYGTRLWPIAREQAPACFAAASAASGSNMLTEALQRIRPLTEHPVHIVTTSQLAQAVCDMLVSQGLVESVDFEMLVLPSQRGSAFAIALAAARIRHSDPQAVVSVMRTDQKVDTDERWERTMYRAYQIALRDNLVVLGGEQTQKCADYTYIRRGRAFPGADNAFEVRLFAADVAPGTARRVREAGAYWYTGVMVARAAVTLGALSTAGELGYGPDTVASHRIAETANFLAMLDPGDWLSQAAVELMEALPVVSYEKAALETSLRMVVIPTTMSFSALTTLSDVDGLEVADRQFNRAIGTSAYVLSCRNTTVYAQECGHQVVALGLKDAMVIDTPDVTLICGKDQLDSMPDAQAELRNRGLSQMTVASRCPYSWGNAALIDRGATHATWRLEVRPGAVVDALTVPCVFEEYQGVMLEERYVVLEGQVTVMARSRNAVPALKGVGDAFEVKAPSARRITASPDSQAVLLLTVVLPQ